jgi:hypothetical protein
MANPFGGHRDRSGGGAGSHPHPLDTDHRTADCTLSTDYSAVKANGPSPALLADRTVRITLRDAWSRA